MILDNAISKTKTLAFIILIQLIIIIVLLITVICVGVTVYNLRNNVNTVVIPMAQSGSYNISNENYSTRYLRDMGLSFISLRLNNTPETIHKKHEELLSYVAVESRPQISAILSDEEKIIIKDDLTTAFYYDEINLYPSHEVFEVKGILKTWSGDRRLVDQEKTYQLQVEYKNGTLYLLNFIEVVNEK